MTYAAPRLKNKKSFRIFSQNWTKGTRGYRIVHIYGPINDSGSWNPETHTARGILLTAWGKKANRGRYACKVEHLPERMHQQENEVILAMSKRKARGYEAQPGMPFSMELDFDDLIGAVQIFEDTHPHTPVKDILGHIFTNGDGGESSLSSISRNVAFNDFLSRTVPKELYKRLGSPYEPELVEAPAMPVSATPEPEPFDAYQGDDRWGSW